MAALPYESIPGHIFNGQDLLRRTDSKDFGEKDISDLQDCWKVWFINGRYKN